MKFGGITCSKNILYKELPALHLEAKHQLYHLKTKRIHLMQVFERILFGSPIWPSQNSTHNSGLQLLGGHLRRHPGLRSGNPGGAALCIYMGLAIPYKILTAKSKSRTCMSIFLLTFPKPRSPSKQKQLGSKLRGKLIGHKL